MSSSLFSPEPVHVIFLVQHLQDGVLFEAELIISSCVKVMFRNCFHLYITNNFFTPGCQNVMLEAAEHYLCFGASTRASRSPTSQISLQLLQAAYLSPQSLVEVN